MLIIPERIELVGSIKRTHLEISIYFPKKNLKLGKRKEVWLDWANQEI